MRFPLFIQKKFVFQLLFWLLYTTFILTDVQVYVRKQGWLFTLFPMLVFFAYMGALILVNFKILIPKLLEKNRIVLYTLGIIASIVLYTVSRAVYQKYLDAWVWPEEPMKLQSYFFWNCLYAFWFLTISTMMYYAQQWLKSRQQVKNIQIMQLQTELKYLRAQINPHFLFNGLNTIYGSIDKANQPARNVLLQFSDLLRYNLYEADVDMVELEKETQYLQNYVALQRARSDSNLEIILDVQVDNPNTQIAPLLFMPFLENAFKFSTRDELQANSIQIKLHQKGNQLSFRCINSIEVADQSTGGIGLTNVTRRLELLYKDRYTLKVDREQGVYAVELNLEL